MTTNERLEPKPPDPGMVCLKCRAILNVPPACSGRKVACPKCGHKQLTGDNERRN